MQRVSGGAGIWTQTPTKATLRLCPVIGGMAVSTHPLAAAFFSPAVHPGLRGSGPEHAAHAHLRLDACLRGEPLQVLPAADLHPHPAGALRCHPGQRPVSPAVHQPQTHQDPEGLGEGWFRQAHTASGPRPGPEDKPRVTGLHPAPGNQTQAGECPESARTSRSCRTAESHTSWWAEVWIPGMCAVIFRMTRLCVIYICPHVFHIDKKIYNYTYLAQKLSPWDFNASARC